MRAELYGLDCATLDDVLLQHYSPQDPDCFALVVDAYIRPAGGGPEDMFQFLARSPRALEDELRETSYVLARNYLILPRFDYGLLWKAISDLCESIEGPDWETVARRIGRYGLWEYDDFYGPRDWQGQSSRPTDSG